MKLIYLASPFTHESDKVMKVRRRKIDFIGANLQKRYKYAIFPPITISDTYSKELPGSFDHSFSAWRKIDLYMVSKSDELWVVTLPGWEESVGVNVELDYAERHNIPIYYINPDNFKRTKKP